MNETINLENAKSEITTKTGIQVLDERIAKLEKAVFENKKEDKEEILNNVEKEYLSAVIKPFRDKVDYVKKYSFDGGEKESIGISFKNDNGYFSFPVFKKGTMYAGMEKYKKYTLKELGI